MAGVDISTEWAAGKIQRVAFEHGVDALFMAAVRCHENGPRAADGTHKFGELGVPTKMAPDYDSQLAVSCKTFRRHLIDFQARDLHALPLLILLEAHTGNRRACYSDEFIAYCAARYAEPGCDTDNGTNKDWAPGVLSFYRRFVVEGVS